MGRAGLNIGIVIQARMRSTRLPGKVLLDIAGRTLLDHILERTARMRTKYRVVIATSNLVQDDPVEDYCKRRGVNCFRGSETDVLDRYFECAKAYGFDHVVRLTGDNPFVDFVELDRLIELHIAGNFQFTSSFEVLPVGVGAEIFAFDALRISHELGGAPHHREHVDEYVLENRDMFRTGSLTVPYGKNCPTVRLTVDTAEDLNRATFILENSDEFPPATEEAIRLCSRFA